MSTVAKLASSPMAFRRPTFFYSSAREGFQDFLRHHCSTSGHGVLLPAFVGQSPREGSGVFDPVRNLSLPHAFYDLHDDLTVDVGKLEQLAASGNYRVLVVIHYYGRCEPRISEVRSLADRHGMVLVEDLAHGLYTAARGGPAGRFGDLSIFSLHKMLPMPDGGMVTYRNVQLAEQQSSTRPELATELLFYDLAGIAERRRENYLGLTARLMALPQCDRSFRLLWPHLNGTDVPQTLPVYIEGQGRDALYDRMNAEGIGVVSLYHTLVDAVREAHPRMVTLSRHVTNLPCHQDLATTDLDAIVRVFRSTLERL